ncbi:hypothetical protein KI387_001131 [Taxus chinensis]|uniref:Beta-glucosidase n=1 Tax=Taxus chinensis TaxID=29808 RepID=A0AA38GVP6_TAXCH|nr:hypothetical protein KI387_001131 [Taxus chinensis]
MRGEDNKTLGQAVVYMVGHVEGAPALDGRKPCVWDAFTHAGKMSDGSTGDVSADQYHHYKEDVLLMYEMGLDAYRFSISWSRLIPDGRGAINPKGLEYYNSLINELVAHGIEPHVTLYHFNLPQSLEDAYGGWLSPQIIEDFKAYTEVCFREFGDRVKHWTTFNEPAFIVFGYDWGYWPPQRCSYPFGLSGNCSAGDSKVEPYIGTHHVLLSHAEAVGVYREKFQEKQKGFIGLALFTSWFVPMTNSTKDIIATQRMLDFQIGCYIDPIVFGDYPSLMKETVGSRLPTFSKQQGKKLRASFDFIGAVHYSTLYVSEAYWPPGERDSIRDSLSTLSRYATANNEALPLSDALNDQPKADYLHSYLESLLSAIRNGSNAQGYFVWSLLDVFEFLYGFELRYGLFYVDFEDKNLKRYPTLSARWYSEFLKDLHQLQRILGKIKRKRVQTKVSQIKIASAMMKRDEREGSVESCITSKFVDINDTDLGPEPLSELIDRSRAGKTSLMRAIKSSGIIRASTFPVTTQLPEFVMECARSYHLLSRTIRDATGNTIIRLDAQFINYCLKIPTRPVVTTISMLDAGNRWEKHKADCVGIMNSKYMKKPRSPSKFLRTLPRSNLVQEVDDITKLLCRINGEANTHNFYSWMYAFIRTIEINKADSIINWAEIISDNIGEQLRSVRRTYNFKMTSYLVYAATSQGIFSKLDRRGILLKDPIFECYPQLTVPECHKDYKVVNDGFFYGFICKLNSDLKTNRVSKEAWEVVSQHGCIFIQFADFTYLRVTGFSGEPVKLPRYPSDKWVIMELCRQLVEMHDLQSKRHKSTGSFPITVGYYSCQSIHKARGIKAEMFSEYEHEFFPARLNFDPYGVAKKTISQEYSHVPSLEDFWMKCRNEYEVRKKDFNRLSVQQVFDYGLARIPADLTDDGPVLLDTYHQMGGDRAALQENIGGCHTIEERSAAVLVNTSNWLLTKGYCLDEALMNQITGNLSARDSIKRKHEGESSRRPEKLKVHKKSQTQEKVTSTAMQTFVFSPQPLRSSPLPEEKLKLQMAEFERALSLDNSKDGSHNTVANLDGEEPEHEMVVHSMTSHSPRSNFSKWLASQSIPEAREEINLEEHDLQLLLSLGGKDRRPKVAKVTSRLIIEESGKSSLRYQFQQRESRKASLRQQIYQ